MAKIMPGVLLGLIIILNFAAADISLRSSNALPGPKIRDEIIRTSTDNTTKFNHTITTPKDPMIFHPSNWTPLIVLMLFLAAVVTIGVPTIIANHLKQNEARKIIPKRRYTLSLSLVDPTEINGFVRM